MTSRLSDALCNALWLCLALASGSACYPTDALADAESPIEASFHFDPDAQRVLVPLTFNGRARRFIVDTGAGMTCFDASLRQELGAPFSSRTFKTGDGNTRVLEVFKPPPAAIGSLPFTVQMVSCADLSGFRHSEGVDCAGVLGMDFLGSRVVRIDFDRGDVSFLKSASDESGSMFPLGLAHQSIPTVVLSVAGGGRRSFVIDTGHRSLADGCLETRVLDPLLAAGRARIIGECTIASITGPSRSRTVLVDEIKLGGFRHRELLFDEDGADAIGPAYLSRFVVTFDFRRMRMYLKPGRRFDDPAQYDLSGAEIIPRSPCASIVSVIKGSAADTAGLKVGDEIHEFDGTPADRIPVVTMRKLLCIPGSHKLRLARRTEVIVIDLVLKRPLNASEASTKKDVR